MTNPFYTATGNPPAQTRGTSSGMRTEFASVQTGFDGVNVAVNTVLPASIAAKGAIAGQAWTGTHDFSGAAEVKVPTPSAISDAVTKAYADGLSFATALPAQAGNAGKTITTNGTTASWSTVYPGISTINATITANTTLAGTYLCVPVAMATAGQSVTLPAANTLPLGGPQYIIRNTGTLAFNVRDNTGVLIAAVPVRGTVLVVLTANGTAGGTWAIGNASEFGFLSTFSTGTSSVVEATSENSYNFNVTALSATSFILAYEQGATYYSRACVCTISGNLIIPGTPVTLEAFNAGGVISIAAISTTQAIVLYEGASSYIRACILNIAGNVISIGTPVTVQSVAACSGCSVSVLSTTQAIVVYAPSSTFYPTACILNVSGSVITPATPLTISTNTMAAPSLDVVSLSATTALVAWGNSGTGYAVVLSVSGSTITANTSIIVEANPFYGPSIALFSSTQAVVAYGSTSTYLHICQISISGTALTAGAPIILASKNTNNVVSIFPLTATIGYAYYGVQSNGGYWSQQFTVLGSTISVTSPLQITATSGSGCLAAAMQIASGQHVLCYSDLNNYPNAIFVEYVK